ncbi:MAG TPA: TonB-dependent receptor [Thermoanaerobaculia bacterium]|nr:TonB-dependent receptor [Thermoanaerobaculia bacterium]
MIRRPITRHFLFWALLAAAPATAQAPGRLAGALTDENGNPIPGGVVEVTETTTHAVHSLATGRDGRYEFPSLPEGTYRISASRAGFQPTVVPDVVVRTGQDALLNIVLKIRNREESIEVLGKASGYQATDATTATKTETPIMETPVSVQVVPLQVLKDQQVTLLDDALLNVSGVIPSGFGSGNGDSFTIRGFDQLGVTFEDGLRLDQYTTAGLQRSMANVERIEVVKGPESVLYGQGEPGGLVNVITRKPQASPSYSLEQQAGSFGEYRTTLDATGPLKGDGTLLYRFDLGYENSGSFRDFIHQDAVFLFPSLGWRPDDKTNVTLALKYATGTQVIDFGLPFLNGVPAPIPISRNLAQPDANRAPTDEFSVKVLASRQLSQNWAVQLAYKSEYHNQPVPNFQLYAGEADEAGELPRLGLTQPTFNQWTNEVVADLTGTFDTGALRHTVLVGFDFYDQYGHYSANFFDLPSINIYHPDYAQPISPPDPANTQYVNSSQDSYGGYLQDQVELPWNLHLLAGFRYGQSITFNDGYGTVTTVHDHPPVTPRIGLLWQALPQVSLYASYTGNYGATPLGDLTPDGVPLPPQSALQYEAGVKTEWFGKRLSATASVYQLTKKNIPTTDPNDPIYTIAIGEARSRGVELDIAGEITPNWRVIGGYSYIEAVITKDNSGLAGLPFPGVPRNSGSLWTTYQVSGGVLKGLTGGAGIVARSSEVDLAAERIPGFGIVNGMISYPWNIGPVALNAQLNMTNLANRIYFVSLSPGSAIPGAPRSFLGAVRAQF